MEQSLRNKTQVEIAGDLNSDPKERFPLKKTNRIPITKQPGSKRYHQFAFAEHRL